MAGNYNTVNFEGIADSLTNYISLDNKESVIIGEDSGKVILVSSLVNTFDNTFIGNKSGEFADKFLDDCRQSNDGTGGPIMKERRKETAAHSIEKVGSELRSKMKFLNSERLVNKDKN